MLFACDRCKTMDQMDLAYPSGYITAVHLGSKHCTCCQGRPWHGVFPREKFDATRDLPCNAPTGIGLG